MKRIDFENTKPTFENGQFKWYVDPYFQKYLENEQADNLPKIKGLGCFVVKTDEIEDYVLIDNKQNIIAGYPYTTHGHEQMLVKINIIKISQHYDEYEKSNI